MKFSTLVLLGVFVFGVSTAFGEDQFPTTEKDESTVISTSDEPKTTTSTVLPITTSSLAPNHTTTPNPNTTTSTTISTTPVTTPSTTPTTEKPTTSTPQPTTSTTAIPSTTPVPHPPRPSHWSTTSFIGGIVFAFGLSAIGFVAWKFYKARNERNYHTL